MYYKHQCLQMSIGKQVKTKFFRIDSKYQFMEYELVKFIGVSEDSKSDNV